MRKIFITVAIYVTILLLGGSSYTQDASKRKREKYKLSTGETLICLVPPPDVMTKADARSLDVTIPKIKDIFTGGGQLGGKTDRQRSFERIRAELADLTMYEIVEYRLCLQAASGVLTKDEYKEAAKELRPKARGQDAVAKHSVGSEKSATQPPVNQPIALSVITIRAMDFVRSRSVKVQVGSDSPPHSTLYGADIVMNAPDYNKGGNVIEYDVTSEREGSYKLFVEYAAEVSRPLRVFINNQLVADKGLNKATGGWSSKNQQFVEIGAVRLRAGQNVLRLSTSTDTATIPHIRTIQFIPN